MIRIRKTKRRTEGNGYVWPDTADYEPSTVGDVFGPRPFASHPTYDYDFHRGIDVEAAQGDPVYSPVGGPVVRRNYNHFYWDYPSHLDHFDIIDDDTIMTQSIATGDVLRVGWDADVAISSTHFLDSAKIISKNKLEYRIATHIDIQVNFDTTLAGLGEHAAYGIAILDEENGEYAAVDWDSAQYTRWAQDNTGSGSYSDSQYNPLSTNVPAWIRIVKEDGSTSLYFYSSSDGVTWDFIDVIIPTFTREDLGRAFKYLIYVRKTATAAESFSGTVDIDFLGGVGGNDIGRFGNWISVFHAGDTWNVMHLAHIVPEQGDYILPGTLLGYAGVTGYDTFSGRVLYPHIHLEYVKDAPYFYNLDAPQNPLRPGLLPRDDVTSNVSVVRTTGNDPWLSVSSHKLTVTVSRADQDFDLNSIYFEGDTTSVTVNWDTRTGIGTGSDSDTPVLNGVAIEGVDFTTASTDYEVIFYFSQAVYGSTFVTATIYDSAGNQLWTE